MAVAGSAGNGQWMEIRDGKLHTERIGVSTIVERDFDRAIGRLLNGERVHVDVYKSMHFRVAATLRVALGMEPEPLDAQMLDSET